MRRILAHRMTRRLFLGSVAAGGLLGGYMRFVAPEALEVGRHSVRLGKERGESARLVHLSDFHASECVSLDFIAEAVELAVSLKPDLICLTGDFITWKYEDFDGYAKVLKKLAQSAPAFACLGNHDGGKWARRSKGYDSSDAVGEMLRLAGVQLLHNASSTFESGERRFNIVGVGDLWADECQPKEAFSRTDSRIPTLVLSHNPDSTEKLGPFPWDLMLCGHTHGGQLSLPIIGRPFAPVKDMRYVTGLNRWNERWIHTSRGVGNLHGMRLNCPPEVSLIELG